MLTSPRGRSLRETRAQERRCGRALPMDGDEPGAMAPSGPAAPSRPTAWSWTLILEPHPRSPSCPSRAVVPNYPIVLPGGYSPLLSNTLFLDPPLSYIHWGYSSISSPGLHPTLYPSSRTRVVWG